VKLAPRLLLPICLCLLLGQASAGASVPAADACLDPEPVGEGKDPGLCPAAGEPNQVFSLGAEAALLVAEADSDTDVTHYLLELELIPEYSDSTVTAVRVEGVSTIDLQATVDGLTSFTVDLHSPLTVNAVTGDVAGWLRVGDTIEITLDRAYAIGEPIQVAVDYQGYPQDGGFGSFRWWIRNGSLHVGTLSEPFYARYWWPCKDALDDKATMEMQVTVPSDLVALSNGLELGSQPLAGDRTRYFWHETQPMIPYLASLAVGPYERYDLQYDYDDGGTPASMPVPCYVYPDNWDYVAGQPTPAVKVGCDELPGMLGTFSGLFGQYPWIGEKYGVVETGGQGGLSASMEHQTLSSMWRINNYSDIMAHELAHQWWGDLVTCETWYDIWLNEGLTSYAEALYREFKSGGSADLYWTRMNQRRPSDPDAQVYRTSIATPGAIFNTNSIYNKGAWVAHMLRHVMGDESFFAALADYRSNFQNDSVTTDEFSASFSTSFGEDLGWFTEQWVMSPGSPDYEWNYATQSVGGQEVLQLAVWQVQDALGYGLFSMPIDVRVTTASGTNVYTVWNDDWAEYYVLPTDGTALAVELDRDGGTADRNWILWNSLAQVGTALAPPPVLLDAQLLRGPSYGAGSTLHLTFSEDIGDFDAADSRLTGRASGIHAPDSWVYDAGARRATLSYTSLPTDAYTLEVFDADLFANGKALDGETDTSAWWDDVELPSGDGQPGGDAVLSFGIAWPECWDGVDNDGDGWVDHPDDPGCWTAASLREAPQCQDGINNDPGQDDLIDFDGGLSALGYTAAGPDPQCLGAAWRNREGTGGCGLGFELTPLLAGLLWLRRRRRAATSP